MGHTESGILSGKVASNQTLVERYTDATRRALNFARLEACHRGDRSVSVAGLVGGVSVDEGTRAERVGSLKANAFYLRWLAGLPPLPAQFQHEDGCADGLQPEFDLDARRALAFAVMEADRDREYW